MYFLLKMGIFHCYVSLPEGKSLGFQARLILHFCYGISRLGGTERFSCQLSPMLRDAARWQPTVESNVFFLPCDHVAYVGYFEVIEYYFFRCKFRLHMIRCHDS